MSRTPIREVPEDGPTQDLQNALALLDALQHELVTRITSPVPRPDHDSLRTLAAVKDHVLLALEGLEGASSLRLLPAASLGGGDRVMTPGGRSGTIEGPVDPVERSVWVQWDDGDAGYAFIHDLRRHP